MAKPKTGKAMQSGKSQDQPKKTFMDLPGEIRNCLYELYGENDLTRLHSLQDTPTESKTPTPRKRGKKGRRKQKDKIKYEPPAEDEARELLFYVPAITRVSREVRQEYISLVFPGSQFIIGVCTNLHIWLDFIDIFGEDVLEHLGSVKIGDLPQDPNRSDSVATNIEIRLLNVEKPVESHILPLKLDSHNTDNVTNLAAYFLLHAARSIQDIVQDLEVKGQRRRLSRATLMRVLHYATLVGLIDDEEWERKKDSYGLLAVVACLWMYILKASEQVGCVVWIIALGLTACWMSACLTGWIGCVVRVVAILVRVIAMCGYYGCQALVKKARPGKIKN